MAPYLYLLLVSPLLLLSFSWTGHLMAVSSSYPFVYLTLGNQHVTPPNTVNQELRLNQFTSFCNIACFSSVGSVCVPCAEALQWTRSKGTRAGSRPGSLCCVSLPLSYPVSCLYLRAVLSIKPERPKNTLRKKKEEELTNQQKSNMSATLWTEVLYVPLLWVDNRPRVILQWSTTEQQDSPVALNVTVDFLIL